MPETVPKKKIMKEWQSAFPFLKFYKPDHLCNTGLYMKHDFLIIGIDFNTVYGKYYPEFRIQGLWEVPEYSKDEYQINNVRCRVYDSKSLDINLPYRENCTEFKQAIEYAKKEYGFLVQDGMKASELLKWIHDYIIVWRNAKVQSTNNPYFMLDWLIIKMALAVYFDDKDYQSSLKLEIVRFVDTWDKHWFKEQMSATVDDWFDGFYRYFERNRFMAQLAQRNMEPEVAKLNNCHIINDLSTMNGNYYPILTPGRFGPIKDYFKKIRYKVNH